MTRSHNVRGASHSFACYTSARPEEVWDALTSASRTPAYLYGLAAHSTWEADAAITAVHESHTRLTGHVLCARPGERRQVAEGHHALTVLLSTLPGELAARSGHGRAASSRLWRLGRRTWIYPDRPS